MSTQDAFQFTMELFNMIFLAPAFAVLCPAGLLLTALAMVTGSRTARRIGVMAAGAAAFILLGFLATWFVAQLDFRF